MDIAGRTRSSRTLVALLLVAACTTLAYSNTFSAPFHFDDTPNIVENEWVRDLHGYWPPSGVRPLGYLTFALNYRVGGLDVFGYHLVNILIHVCNGLLVYWLAAVVLRTPRIRRAEVGPLVRGYLPLVAALLFTVHPIETQAVTYIVQRFTSLATLFYLLSLVLHLEARLRLDDERPSETRAAVLYGLSAIAGAAAMETKEISFTLPFVAAGLELLFFGASRRLLYVAPLMAISLLVPMNVASSGLSRALSDRIELPAETREIPRFVYLLTQSRVLVTYLRLLLLPVGQNLDHDFSLSHSPGEPGVVLALGVLLALSAGAVLSLVRAQERNRAVGILFSMGVGWFFVTSSIESSVIPISDVMFEHRAYLPSVGLVIAFGAVLLSVLERARLRLAPATQVTLALLLTVGPLEFATFSRNAVWTDELTLWTDVVTKSPRKARPHNNLGTVFEARGRREEAVREFREAIRVDPGYAIAHCNLGVILADTGLLEKAIGELREAVRLEPSLSVAHRELGVSYGRMGQLEDAVRELREAIRLAPSASAAHRELGVAYGMKGSFGEAARELREAIRLDPTTGLSHYNLAVIYDSLGQLDDAVREYHEMLRLLPAHADSHNNLGVDYQRMGRLDDAVREYREAIRLDPLHARAQENLRALPRGVVK